MQGRRWIGDDDIERCVILVDCDLNLSGSLPFEMTCLWRDRRQVDDPTGGRQLPWPFGG